MSDLDLRTRAARTDEQAVRPSTVVPTRKSGRIREWVRRTDATTPSDRDRSVDALAALAVLGVVVGNWLVSAVVRYANDRLLGASPQGGASVFAPVSWALSTLPVFFLAGGYVAAKAYDSARSRGTGYRDWLSGRTKRCFGPVTPVLQLWALVVVGLFAFDISHETIRTLLTVALTPLWFLLVLGLLTAATPLALRAGAWGAVAGCVLVAALDAAHAMLPGSGLPAQAQGLNVIVGWWVPFSIGVYWAAGGFSRRRPALLMLVGGGLCTLALVLWGPYSAHPVDLLSQGASALRPVALPAVAFGVAQCGAALVLRSALRRAVRPSLSANERLTVGNVLWTVVVTLNFSAIAVLVWHQTALLLVTVAGLGSGRLLPGLHIPAEHLGWLLARAAWLPVFAVVLVALLTLFNGARKPHPRRNSHFVANSQYRIENDQG
ncbi:acyltransferase [Streptomyces sp. NBC_00057]|uniref:acyltransferase n=1 Tax=Streptomyces sp. NBC_00057 TaxID=2975634 RepID=UPI00324D92A6